MSPLFAYFCKQKKIQTIAERKNKYSWPHEYCKQISCLCKKFFELGNSYTRETATHTVLAKKTTKIEKDVT